MILSLTYNFFYNKNDLDILSMSLSNLKVYAISTAFYLILYTLILYLDNLLIKKIFYIVFIFDIFYLVINIISTVLPSEYSIIKSIKKKLNIFRNEQDSEEKKEKSIEKPIEKPIQIAVEKPIEKKEVKKKVEIQLDTKIN